MHVACTWYRARPHGGSLDNVDTESTGERNAPPVHSDERSEMKHVKVTATAAVCVNIQSGHEVIAA